MSKEFTINRVLREALDRTLRATADFESSNVGRLPGELSQQKNSQKNGELSELKLIFGLEIWKKTKNIVLEPICDIQKFYFDLFIMTKICRKRAFDMDLQCGTPGLQLFWFNSLTILKCICTLTCSWHQKLNSPILQFSNLKCYIKAKEPYKTHF